MTPQVKAPEVLVKAIPEGIRITVNGNSWDRLMTPEAMRNLAIELLMEAQSLSLNKRCSY